MTEPERTGGKQRLKLVSDQRELEVFARGELGAPPLIDGYFVDAAEYERWKSHQAGDTQQ